MARQAFTIKTRSAQPWDKLFVTQANGLMLTLIVEIDGLVDLADADSITCEIRAALNDGEDPVAAVVLPGSAGPFIFVFDGADTNIAIPEGKTTITQWLVVNAAFHPSGQAERLETLYQAALEVRAHGSSQAISLPNDPMLTISRAEAAALYRQLPPVNVEGEGYTFSLDDVDSAIRRSHTAACSSTVPPESEAGWLEGLTLTVRNAGLFAHNLVEGEGVTILRVDTLSMDPKTGRVLHYLGDDTWDLY